MNLSPMQLFCQNEIVKSAHPWLSLEEAKEVELKAKWCLVTVLFRVVLSRVSHVVMYDEEKYRDKKHDIIGLPPSLARVLNALGEYNYCYYEWKIIDNEDAWCDCQRCKYCCWIWRIHRKLLNEDWTDATLRDQSEETQESIALLLWWKDELG